MIDDAGADPLSERLHSLPQLYVELLEACVDQGQVTAPEQAQGRRKGGEPVAAPLELNLTILDFLSEPSIDGHLGFARSLLALATVTRAAFGGVAPSPMDRQVEGMRYLQRLNLEDRIEQMSAERLVEVAQVAHAVRYLEAQAQRIRAGEHWTPAAAAHVSGMYDEATVGLDDRLYEVWGDWREASRRRLAELDPADTDVNELMSLAVAGFDVSRIEYVGLHLDSVRRWYAAAAAGGEQWGDFVAEEVYRLHSRAESLLGQAQQRSRVVDVAACPFCDAYELVIVVHPPKASCEQRTRRAMLLGQLPPEDRCCGEFVQCTSCSRQISLRVDPESHRSEASTIFAAFRSAGWVPRPRPAMDDERTEQPFRAVVAAS